MQLQQQKKMSRPVWPVALACILLASAIVRLINIHLVRNVDEVYVVKYALAFASGNMHLPWYNWPAQSLMRLDGAIFAIVHLVQNIFHGVVASPIITTPINLQWFTIAHCITVFISLLCILATWNVALLVTESLGAATLSSALLGISSLHVTHSRFATPDMALTTLCVCSVWIAILMVRTCVTQRRKNLAIIAGICIGVSVATKYTGAMVCVPLVVGALGSWYRHRMPWKITHLLWCTLAAIIVHMLLNPFFLSDITLVQHALTTESNPVRIGADWGDTGGTFFKNATYYVRGLQFWSGTLISWIAGVTFIVCACVWKRTQQLWLCAIFICAYVCGISLLGLHWSRWALPLTPFVAIYASVGLSYVWRWCSTTRTPRRVRTTLAALALCVCCAPQLIIATVSVVVNDTHTTSRTIAQCIRETFPAGSRIVADGYLFNEANGYTVDEIGISVYEKTVQQWRDTGVAAILVAPKRIHDAKQNTAHYQFILDRFAELKTEGTRVCAASPTTDDILDHKKDWGVYRYLWQHHNDPNLFTIIEGDGYVVYDISAK